MATHNSYGSLVGKEFSTPTVDLLPDKLELGWMNLSATQSASTTIASSESDALLEDCYNTKTVRSDSSHESAMMTLDKPSSSSWWRLLGFTSNPLQGSDEYSNSRNSTAADMRLAMLSNWSTAYNTVNISLALTIMESTRKITVPQQSLCTSSLIAGMIVGQLVGGTLGDVLGRHRAMAVVMCFQVMAAFSSALSCDLYLPINNTTISLYLVLAFWRFVLGVGCGGVYPLAATMTAETTQDTNGRAKLVALTFSMQGFGYLTVTVTSWLLVTLVPAQYAWRLLLGFGCVPGVVLTILRTRHGQPREPKELNEFYQEVEKVPAQDLRTAPVSISDAIMMEGDLGRKLCGTAGCWFIFDVLFYGNTLFQPEVLAEAFGAAETLSHAARDTTMLTLMALPGYIVSIAMVGRQSPRYIQMQGFAAMAILYTVIGVRFDSLAGRKVVLLILYGATFFFSNYGPNSTTFMLSSITFSKSCRSTLNGICAACGKVGALLGALVFYRASGYFGNTVVMLACAALSMVGLVMTLSVRRQAASPDEEQQVDELLLDRMKPPALPLKVVYSGPSLFDSMDENA